MGGIPRLASRTLAQQRGSPPNVSRPYPRQVTLTHDERAFMIGADHE
jgi:hypothetical protein